MGWSWTRKRVPPPATQLDLEPTSSASVSFPESLLSLMANSGGANYSGVDVREETALGLSGVYRSVSVISGTIGQLPLRSMRDMAGNVERVPTVLDDPMGVLNGLTPFEWVETTLLHLLLHGNAYLVHVYNGAGALIALAPQHPLLVEPFWPCRDDKVLPVGGKWYWVTDIWGGRTLHDATTLTHIPAQSTDGLKGFSVIQVARNSLGTGIAGERSAAKVFSSGALMSGIAVPEDDLTLQELKDAREELNRHLLGWEHAGSIRVVNRKLTFTPWAMSAADAQFMESRKFGVEEVARWFGVPPHLLMQTEKQTSWGQGVSEQNRGLGKFTLSPWTSRVEQRLSRLLGPRRWCEFDFAALERPNFETETGLIIAQVQAGLLTVDEARALRNYPPLTPDATQGAAS